MVFNSFPFMFFFIIVLAVFYIMPVRFRHYFLLVAGYYFYMCFKPENLIILVFSTGFDYYLGQRMAASIGPTRKKWLVLGLIHNIGMLAALKYLHFLNEAAAALLHPFNITLNAPALSFLAPVGISYYTFKKLSYLLDIYRETRAPEPQLSRFALYVSFFPAIMAGPIDRPGILLSQMDKVAGFDYQRIREGLLLIVMGFFKKVVIADRLTAYVSLPFNNPQLYKGPSLMAAAFYFSIQIYCDFSGYTDMARGIGKLLGYDLSENFNRPYFSRSIGEFWKRWHITLSSWLMDYLFLPIAYAISRKIKAAEVLTVKTETWAYLLGITSTMLLCGLWHGASWTYVLWGLIHGLLLALSFSTKKLRRKLNKKLNIKKESSIHHLFQIILTFSVVTWVWIFFRASTLAKAWYMVTHLFTGWTLHPTAFINAICVGLLKKELAVAIISVCFIWWTQWVQGQSTFPEWLSRQKTIVRWSIYLGLVVWILTFAESSLENFIYFKF